MFICINTHQIKEDRRADVYMFALERVFWEVEKKEAVWGILGSIYKWRMRLWERERNNFKKFLIRSISMFFKRIK